ncbi:hypothetical protein N7523_005572 [Penicillium sp. IBT 18751x]|nr:hypothetical protein N7523_005842 [Penicillium sp. IBT 18751x]KAJ6117821.1 hypothetical protein N7523_005572 [Penicillium sp. IBT 18751x]
MLTSPAARHIVNAYNSINLRSLVPKLYKWKMDRFLLFTKRKPIIAAGKWIAQNVRNRSESSEEYNDIYQFLTEAENTHETLHYDEKGLWAESMLLFAAGADTTSTTLSALFFYLLHNPTRLSRLEREIRETFKNESDITKFATGNGNDDKLQSCIYLQACVRETMRLVPAVTNLSPRLVRSGGMILAGTYVPHGTHVGGSLYTALRNKSHFEDPDAFDPERWIPEGESKPTKLKDWPGSIPFGTGLHSCVGKSLAKLQLELTVARTVFKYDLTLLGEACEDAVFPFNAWAVAKGKTAQTGAEYSAGLAY